MPREFSTVIASRVTGASVRQLDTWARTGLLPSSGRPAFGKGSRRSYTFQDMVSIRTIVDLRDRKCPLQQIRAAVRELKKLYPELSNSQTLSRLTLLTDGKRVYIVTDETQAMDVLTRQNVWAVPLGRHIIETTARVKKLPQVWTEEVVIENQRFHIRITGCDKARGYSAHCREFPGTLEHADTPAEATSKVTTAVRAVQAFFARNGRDESSTRRRLVN